MLSLVQRGDDAFQTFSDNTVAGRPSVVEGSVEGFERFFEVQGKAPSLVLSLRLRASVTLAGLIVGSTQMSSL